MRTAKNKWSLLLLVLAGIVLGGFIGQLLGGMSAFHWLNFGQTFGLTNPGDPGSWDPDDHLCPDDQDHHRRNPGDHYCHSDLPASVRTHIPDRLTRRRTGL